VDQRWCGFIPRTEILSNNEVWPKWPKKLIHSFILAQTLIAF
jgi:hypothetical protein